MGTLHFSGMVDIDRQASSKAPPSLRLGHEGRNCLYKRSRHYSLEDFLRDRGMVDILKDHFCLYIRLGITNEATYFDFVLVVGW